MKKRIRLTQRNFMKLCKLDEDLVSLKDDDKLFFVVGTESVAFIHKPCLLLHLILDKAH